MTTEEQMIDAHEYVRSIQEVNVWGEVKRVRSDDSGSVAWTFWFQIDAKTQTLRQEVLNRMLTYLFNKHPKAELHVSYPSFHIATLMQHESDNHKGDDDANQS